MRALVLEDDLRLRSLVVRTLTRVGLACDEASRIEEAEELLELHDYDLLVLDRRLPDGDGLDVCRRARIVLSGVAPISLGPAMRGHEDRSWESIRRGCLFKVVTVGGVLW